MVNSEAILASNTSKAITLLVFDDNIDSELTID